VHALAYLYEIAKSNTMPPEVLTINYDNRTNWGGGKLVILPFLNFYFIFKNVIRIKASIKQHYVAAFY